MILVAIICTVMGVAAGLFIGWEHWGDEHRGYVIGRDGERSGWLHDGWVCTPDWPFDPQQDKAAFIYKSRSRA